MNDEKLIVGLGNPGKDYEYSRHNLGFLVMHKFAEQMKASFDLSSFTNGLTAETVYAEKRLWLLMPLTYMNNSGVAVKHVVDKKEISLDNVLIISDDINLEFQQLRLRHKGSDGGHNGLLSIIEKLDSQDFSRLRLGLGHPGVSDQVDYVLDNFNKDELKKLDDFIIKACECITLWVEKGSQAAMEKFNRRS